MSDLPAVPANTFDNLENLRQRVEALATIAGTAAGNLMLDMMGEIETLTRALTEKAAADSFYRFHVFDGIKDDMCPACRGRVVVDASDPQRIRIRAVQYQSAS